MSLRVVAPSMLGAEACCGGAAGASRVARGTGAGGVGPTEVGVDWDAGVAGTGAADSMVEGVEPVGEGLPVGPLGVTGTATAMGGGGATGSATGSMSDLFLNW